MINFKTLKWVNLGSYGDRAFNINFHDAKVWAFVGKNGTGKSTIIDALSFVLYGKPWRKTVKAKLVNNKNKRALKVQIEFETPSGSYKVVRGIKPDIFEIWHNSVQINQDSKSRDFQAYLETEILGLSWEALNQVMIIGKAKYVPFLQLNTEARRAFVESVLDLEIFTAMRKVANADASGLERDFAVAKNSVENIKSLILQCTKTHENYLTIKAESNTQEIAKTESELENVKNNIQLNQNLYEAKLSQSKTLFDTLSIKYREEYSKLKANFDESYAQLKGFGEIVNVASSCLSNKKAERQSKLTEITKLESRIRAMELSKVCITCKRPLENGESDEHINAERENVESLKSEIVVIDKEIAETSKDVNELMTEFENMEIAHTGVNAALLFKTNQRVENDPEIIALNKDSDNFKFLVLENQRNERMLSERLSKQKESMQKMDELIVNSEIELRDNENKLKGLEENLVDIDKVKNALSIVVTMLKDNGIKAVIMRRYITVINKIVNKLLSDMGLFAVFELNETFEDKILTRGFEEMSYHLLSEGEKLRIDMAVLLAWRELCVLTGSASTNLIVLDEILDASLDQEGLDAFMNLLNQNKDLNIVCITHHPTRLDFFIQRQLNFTKVDGYSLATIGDR